TPIFSNNFFKLVEGSEHRKLISAINSADAIVVLSGMLGINEIGNSTYIEWGDPDRFFGGIALFKAGKAQKLVFTGGKMPWDKAKKTEGEVLKEYAISNGIPAEKIFVTKDVENTADEAVAVKELISPSKKIILVTSAFHMYRAKRLFEKRGFEVVSYNVDYKIIGNSKNTLMDLLPSAGNLKLTETGVRELLGRLFYLIKN
ncbi:YdcF family protein, partial [bacterium]|nr:YdcF family protein [bacterium]